MPIVARPGEFKPSDPFGFYRDRPNPFAPAPAPVVDPEEERRAAEIRAAEEANAAVDAQYSQLEQSEPGRYAVMDQPEMEQWQADWQARQPGWIEDTARLMGGSLAKGTGAVVGGLGMAINALTNATTTPLINQIFGTDYGQANPLGAPAEWVTTLGEKTQEGMSFATREAIANSTPDGDLLDPSTWSLGKNPSLVGYTALTLDVFGQMAPVIAASVFTGPVGAAAVGGLQGGGAAARQAETLIDQMAAEPGVIERESAYYREQIAAGRSHEEALAATKAAAAQAAFALTAPISALGGAATGKILDPAAVVLAGRNLVTRIIGRAALSGLEEGAQEAAESVATTAGVNVGAGAGLNATEGTFADFVLGALGGSVPGAAAGALSTRAGAAAPADEAIPGQEPAAPVIETPAAPAAPATAQPRPSGPLSRALEHGLANAPASAEQTFIVNDPPLPGMGAGAAHGQAVTLAQDQNGIDPSMARVVLPDGSERIMGKRLLQTEDGQTMAADPQGAGQAIAPLPGVAGLPQPGARAIVTVPDLPQFNATIEQFVEAEDGSREAIIVDDDGEVLQVPVEALSSLNLSDRDIEALERADNPPPPATPQPEGVRPLLRDLRNAQGEPTTLLFPDELAARLFDYGAERAAYMRGAKANGHSALDIRESVFKPDVRQELAAELGVPPEGIDEIADDYRYRAERAARKGTAEVVSKMHGLNSETLARWRTKAAEGPSDGEAALDIGATTDAANETATSPDTDAAWWDGLQPGARKALLAAARVKRSEKSTWDKFSRAIKAKLTPLRAEMEGLERARATSLDNDKLAPEPAAEDSTEASLDTSAHAAATSPLNDLPEPTSAQKEAGNYKLGHHRLGGLDLSIENPAGSERKGTDKGGKAWSVTMKSHYGYIKGTVGKDKDHIDVFVKPGTEALDDGATVTVINQVGEGGRFDEHKVMLGFSSQAEAEAAYMENYTKDWKGLGSAGVTTLGAFKAWLKDGDTSKPFQQRADTPAASAPAPAEPTPAATDNTASRATTLRPPQTVYHGTSDGGFASFDTYGGRYGLFGSGGYFTENRDIALEYTRKGRGEAPMVYRAHLAVNKPLDMDGPANVPAWVSAFPDYIDEAMFAGTPSNEQIYREVEEALSQEMIPDYEGAEIMQDGVRAMGHDAITHLGGGRHRSSSGIKHRVWIVFDPEQISGLEPDQPRETQERASKQRAETALAEAEAEGAETQKPAPDFAAYRAALPLDESGDPDLEGAGRRLLDEIGGAGASWASLSASQKRKAVEMATREARQYSERDNDAPAGWGEVDVLPESLSATEKDELRAIVQRVSGLGDVEWHDRIRVEGYNEGWGKDVIEAAGFYSPARDVVALTTQWGNPRTAYHEAFHRIQWVFLTPQERKLLASYEGTFREMLKGHRPDTQIAGMALSELEAEAFALWAVGAVSPPADKGIAGAWRKVKETIERAVNYLTGLGYSIPADIFVAAKSGTMAERTPHPRGSRARGDRRYSIAPNSGPRSMRQHGFSRDTPFLAPFRNDRPLKSHSDYRAAKDGSIEAAVNVIADIVPDSLLAEVADRFDGMSFVAVHAQEAGGVNKLPVALATRLAIAADGNVDQDIVQAGRTYHTGAGPMERLIAPVSFDGAVVVGRRYVLVDDVSVMGSTLAGLADHIIAGGGEVAGVVTLANASRVDHIAATKQQAREIERRFGDVVRSEFQSEPAALTGAEAAYLLNFRDADALRTRIAAAGSARIERLRLKGVQQAPGSEGRRNSVADAGRPGDNGPDRLSDVTSEEVGSEGAPGAPTIVSRPMSGNSAKTPRAVRTALRRAGLGALVDALEQAGRLRIIQAADDAYVQPGMQGWTDPDGSITLVADQIEGDPVAVLLHEAFHSGAHDLLGSSQWRQLMIRLAGLFRQFEQSKGRAREFFDAARARVQQAEEAGDRLTEGLRIEEFAAYAIEEHATAPAALAKWVDDLIGAVKAWALRRFGRQIGTITPAQLAAIARQALATHFESEAGRTAMASRRKSIAAPKSLAMPKWDREAVTDAILGKLTDLKPAMMAAIPLNYFTELKRPGMAAVDHYLKVKRLMDAYRGNKHAKVDEIAQEWQRYVGLGIGGAGAEGKSRAAVLADLMHETTLAGVDPSLTDEETRAKPGYAALRKRFLALPKNGQSLYVKVRDTYKEQADEMDAILLDNVRKTQEIAFRRAEEKYRKALDEIAASGKTGLDKSKAERDAQDTYSAEMRRATMNMKARMTKLRLAFEASRVPAPYFPLARFGQYFVSVKDLDGTVISFSRRETDADRRRLEREMRAAHPTARVESGRLPQNHSGRDMMDPRIVAEIESLLGDAGVDAKVMDQIWQRYLETMPDLSARKRFIHRKGIAGFEGDALRAFASNQFHAAHQMARLKYGLELTELTNQAVDQAKASDDPVKGVILADELKRRHDWVMNPTGSRAVQAVTSTMFVWYLAASPAAALVNMAQTPMMALPVLGARLGGVGKATAALLRASGDIMRGRGTALRAGLSEEERKAMEAFYESGMIDRTQAHDLAGVGEVGVAYSPLRHKIMSVISWAYHNVEVWNREVTALAAYRLAREQGHHQGKAIDIAHELTWMSHFDYSNASRPRAMQGDVQKLALVFMSHQVNMWYRLFRDVHQAVKGESPQARKEARYQLAGIMAMTTLFSGVTGLFGYNVLMALLGLAFDDDDDPRKFQDEVEGHIVDLLGPDLGGMVLKGVPGHLTGVDLTSRLGMPDFFVRAPDSGAEGREWFQELIVNAFGVVPSTLINGVDGAGLILQGDVARGLEVLAPKGVKDIMQAWRYANEGVLSRRGDTYLAREQLTPIDVAIEALGFTPAKVAETYERMDALKDAEQRVLDERRELMNRFALAVSTGDPNARRAAIEAIKAWNRKPYARMVPITGDSLSQSLKSRASNAQKREDGVLIPDPELNRYLRELMPEHLY